MKTVFSFIVLAPTFLEVAGIPWSGSGMAPAAGISLADVFNSGKTDAIQPRRDPWCSARSGTTWGVRITKAIGD